MQRSRSSAISGEIGIGFSKRALREGHARVAGPVAEGQVLQRALAALVADGAVERVVDEDELERRVLALGRLRRGARGLDDHPVLRGERAAGLQLRHPFDLDEAHAAGADGRPEPRLVAEDGNLDPGGGAVSTMPVPFGTCTCRSSIVTVTSSGAAAHAHPARLIRHG